MNERRHSLCTQEDSTSEPNGQLCFRVSMAACQSVGGFILALLLSHMNERVAVF